MDLYSRFLVQFLYTLQNELRGVSTFVFSTRLNEVTHLLRTQSFEDALERLTTHVDAWSGGTSIGASLYAFDRLYARRRVSSRTVILIVSDGWDRGDTALLKKAMQSFNAVPSKSSGSIHSSVTPNIARWQREWLLPCPTSITSFPRTISRASSDSDASWSASPAIKRRTSLARENTNSSQAWALNCRIPVAIPALVSSPGGRGRKPSENTNGRAGALKVCLTGSNQAAGGVIV